MAVNANKKATVRTAEKSEKTEKPKSELTVDYVGECEKALTKQLGRRVKIVSGKRKGRFELEFYGEDDLQRLYDALLSLRQTEENNV